MEVKQGLVLTPSLPVFAQWALSYNCTMLNCLCPYKCKYSSNIYNVVLMYTILPQNENFTRL